MNPSHYFAELNVDATRLVQACNSYLDSDPPIIKYKTDSEVIHDVTAENDLTKFDKSFRYFEVYDMDIWRVLQSCPFLEQLNIRHKIYKAGILSLHPNFYYRLHTDFGRGVAINMLLSGEDSHCLFVDDTDFVELKYNKNKLYLFNTQKPHTVINFSQQRLMFSVTFAENKDALSYEQLYKKCERIGVL